MTDTLINRIEHRCKALGWSERKACLAADIGVDTIRDIRRRGGNAPGGDKVARLAAALGVTADWLLTGGDAPPPPTDALPANRQKKDTSTPHYPDTLPPFDKPLRDVPVRGTAAGAVTGAFQIDTDPIDYAHRLPGIAQAKNVYALYIVGNSMEPRYFPGDLVYVHPDRPARSGDFVIIQIRNHDGDHVQAYVKRLVKKTTDWLIVEQYNPIAEMKMKAATVLAVHRILNTDELAGV